jgi:hypothetical protein
MSQLAGFPLNGSDAFMLAMDAAMAQVGTSRNVCHLLITLSSTAEIDASLGRVRKSVTLAAVSRLRLSRTSLCAPRWVTRQGEEAPAVRIDLTCVTDEDLHSGILSHQLDPRCTPPFGVIALPMLASGPSLLFYWHHALCDAHGGEMLVRQVVSLSNRSEPALTPATAPRTPLKERLRRAHNTKKLIFERSSSGIARLPRLPSHQPLQRYAHISFSKEDTEIIDRAVTKVTGGMFSTALYLAATCRALTQTSAFSHAPLAPLFIPVPHDMRRTTKERSPLSNQTSVAFFRIEQPLASTLTEITNTIIGQLHDTIAEQHYRGMLDFFRLIRRLPSLLFWKIIERPTAGHPASFYFSDIGSSLSAMQNVFDTPVQGAIHYPPNLAPPGLTTVWSRYRGCLRITLCFDQTSLPNNFATSFETHLRDELFGAAA